MLGKIKITDFAKRQFEKKSSGTKITSHTPEEFEIKLNSLVIINGIGKIERVCSVIDSTDINVLDGYAPFCKLLVIQNFTTAKVGSMKIDLTNFQYIRHGYSARTEKELSVLTRWFELPLPVPKAEYLVIIVYSREQLEKEHEAAEKKKEEEYNSQNPILAYVIKDFEFKFDSDVEWGIVAILGQSHPNEEPMAPITIMRNALGVEEGGSGVAIDRKKYQTSVEFWKDHAIIKS